MAAAFSADVAEIAYVSKTVWQENTSNQWYSWTGSAWSAGNDPLPTPTPTPTPAPSPDGTTILSPYASPIIDGQGNKWSLVQSANSGWQIAENGKVDPVTAQVALLQISKGNIIQENARESYYSEPASGGSWTQIAQPASIISPDHLSLILSEDAWEGNAQFIVAVDGKQIGGPTSVTALHSQGATQEFDYGLNLAAGSHAVTVSFINDAWGGTASTDRNLYVDNVLYNGASYLSAQHPLDTNGSVSVTVKDLK